MTQFYRSDPVVLADDRALPKAEADKLREIILAHVDRVPTDVPVIVQRATANSSSTSPTTCLQDGLRSYPSEVLARLLSQARPFADLPMQKAPTDGCRPERWIRVFREPRSAPVSAQSFGLHLRTSPKLETHVLLRLHPSQPLDVATLRTNCRYDEASDSCANRKVTMEHGYGRARAHWRGDQLQGLNDTPATAARSGSAESAHLRGA